MKFKTPAVALAGLIAGALAIPLGTSFNAMASRLEETERSRQQLVSDVAHELRNPIRVLQGHLEAAQDGVLPPLDGTTVDSLVMETRHLGQLVRDLQEISLAETAALRIDPKPTNLFDLSAGVVASHAALHAEVSVSCKGAEVIATVDPLRIRQVVEDLVGNALTHTASGGVVTVTISRRGDSADIVVLDNGSGIAEAEIGFVFDRFWRGDSSRTRATGGSGLGLSISRAIVEAHGGSIGVRSEQGKGSSFAVSLPASRMSTQ